MHLILQSNISNASYTLYNYSFFFPKYLAINFIVFAIIYDHNIQILYLYLFVFYFDILLSPP